MKIWELLKNLLSKKNLEEVPAPVNEDFYINEQGLTVFTEKYLLERGYCCENGCKHCPYGYRKPIIKK